VVNKISTYLIIFPCYRDCAMRPTHNQSKNKLVGDGKCGKKGNCRHQVGPHLIDSLGNGSFVFFFVYSASNTGSSRSCLLKSRKGVGFE
jgi:hypothetical protein